MRTKIRNERTRSDSSIVLSIGMIVKNEEKVLRKCLESLKPLLSEIDSELIIADTGSEDSTLEIAKEYTDKAFSYSWNDNFADARNSTVNRAIGKWYMYLDADEYIDGEVQSMIEFFNSPELYMNYNSADVDFRNFRNDNKDFYESLRLVRLFRLYDDTVRFTGSVHEAITASEPIYHFKTIVYHTGYNYTSDLQLKNKMERNLKLLRPEVEKNPDNLRLIAMMIDACVFNKEERKHYIEHAMNLVEKDRKNPFSNYIVYNAINYKKEQSEFTDALKLCNRYFSEIENPYTHAFTLCILTQKISILMSLERKDEAYEECLKYIDLYKKYKSGELDVSCLAFGTGAGISEFEYHKIVFVVCGYLICNNNYSKTNDFLIVPEIIHYENDIFKMYIDIIKELCTAKSDYYELLLCYDLIKKESSDENKLSFIIDQLNNIYISKITDEERRIFAQNIVSHGFESEYIDLMRIVINESLCSEDEIKSDIEKVLNQINNWEVNYFILIWYAVRYRIDLSFISKKISIEKFREQLSNASDIDDSFSEYVIEYGCPEHFFEEIKSFSCLIELYDVAVRKSLNLSDKNKSGLYKTYISLLENYISNIYRPELLNDDDVCVLPENHRFGYFMGKANMLLCRNDKIGYIRELKKTLLSCNSMREIIEFLLYQFKSNI